MNKSKPMTRPYIRRDWDDDLVTRYRMSRPKSKADYITSYSFRIRLFERIIKYLGDPAKKHIGERMYKIEKNKHSFIKKPIKPKLKNHRPFYGLSNN